MMNFKVTRKAEVGQIPAVSVLIAQDQKGWASYSLDYEASRILTDTTSEDGVGLFRTGQTGFSKGPAKVYVQFDDFFENLKGKSCKAIADQIGHRCFMVHDAFKDEFPAIDEESEGNEETVAEWPLLLQVIDGKPKQLYFDGKPVNTLTSLLPMVLERGKNGYKTGMKAACNSLGSSWTEETPFVWSYFVSLMFHTEQTVFAGDIETNLRRISNAINAACAACKEYRERLFPDGFYNISEQKTEDPGLGLDY